ncbi:hypothetical protein ACQKII_22045 [Lysinibacillus sp. NPDC048646]|uniref:hypothetical protein n=1 Tax=Lysinibacillus sp. NPDC048646 TaxID=3390574 RepID=UPI003CFC2E43
MKKNILIIVSIIMLFIVVFFIGNWHYFSTENPQIVVDGAVTIEEGQLQKNNIVKLEGEWSFYPNVLISQQESLDTYKDRRMTIDVPANWHDFVQENEEGLAFGTYHVKVKVLN